MTGKIYVPPIKIQGIKTKLVPIIRENVVVNRHTIWIEPFMGSGVVGFNLEPERAVFSDLNPYVIDFYNQLNSGAVTSYIVRGFLEQEGEKLARYDVA
ncbi:MAG: DNA adenine methylase, partial [Oscillibacter sp.]|nr:DNA adenine methylase [Oscillibacter sp.]